MPSPRLFAATLLALALPAAADEALKVGSYAGTVLCGDCPGIRTELELYEAAQDPFRKNYVLRETYLETRDGDRTLSSRGSWDYLRGTPDDPDATVLELSPEQGQGRRLYLQGKDGALRMLDGDQQELPSALPHTLRPTRLGQP